MGSKQLASFVSKILPVVTVTVILVSAAWAASTEKVAYSFTGGNDGGDPAATLVADAAGNLYGTTVNGGTGRTVCTIGCGTVFELSPVAGGKWKEKVLYSFTGGSDGKNPYGGVILDSKGNLYGTTVAGGSGGACSSDGCGVVFLLSKSGKSWVETVMYNFTGGKDGFGPGGALAFDSAGNLYGSTPDGGNRHKCSGGGCGVVYQISPVRGGGWKQTVLHTFTNGADGAVGSLGPLLVDRAGNVFGVAELGGDKTCKCGVVFELTPASGKWNFKTLDSFKGIPNAGFPYGGVIADSKGNLYGTTYYAGAMGVGSVYKLTNTKGTFTESVLYSFTGGADGKWPTTTLMFDGKGNLYGTTSAGGDSNGDGVVFKLTPKSGGKWAESVAHQFGKGSDGRNPYYGLISDKAGHLLGTTAIGGGSGQGVVFQITP